MINIKSKSKVDLGWSDYQWSHILSEVYVCLHLAWEPDSGMCCLFIEKWKDPHFKGLFMAVVLVLGTENQTLKFLFQDLSDEGMCFSRQKRISH